MQNHRRLWSKHFSSLAIQGPPFCPCPSPSICTFTYLYSFIIREGKNLNFTALHTVATYRRVRKEQKNPKQTKNKHHTHVPIQQGITKESKEHHIAELFTCWLFLLTWNEWTKLRTCKDSFLLECNSFWRLYKVKKKNSCTNTENQNTCQKFPTFQGAPI